MEISPLGLAHQASINKHRENIEKYRVTHDLSFPKIALETSINEWMDRGKVAETHYENMHKHLLHSIVNMW